MPTKKTARGKADAGRMSDAARLRVQTELANGKDETNPAFLYQQTATALLLAIVNGLIDPVLLARRELAARGRNGDGEWCGFEGAQQIHLGEGSDR